MYVTFRVALQINHQRVCMHHGGIQIIIQFRVAHQESEGAFIAIELGRHLLHILKGIVDLGHRGCEVQIVEVARQTVGIAQESQLQLLTRANWVTLANIDAEVLASMISLSSAWGAAWAMGSCRFSHVILSYSQLKKKTKTKNCPRNRPHSSGCLSGIPI